MWLQPLCFGSAARERTCHHHLFQDHQLSHVCFPVFRPTFYGKGELWPFKVDIKAEVRKLYRYSVFCP